MYNQDGDATEPEWVKTEREQFSEFRDKNKDGKMDKEETRDWILPTDYDHAEAEAKHLVYESDADKVSTVEVLNELWLVFCEFYSLPSVQSERTHEFMSIFESVCVRANTAKSNILALFLGIRLIEHKNVKIQFTSLYQDGRLTKAEIVDKYDLFVGSQATDFGEALTRHDEF